MLNGAKAILIWDRLQAHRSKEVRSFLAAHGIDIVLLPGYQGGTPIEYLDEQLGRTGGDPFLKATATAGATESTVAPAQRAAAVDLGARAVGKAVADALAPGMSLWTDAFKEHTRAMEQLKQLNSQDWMLQRWGRNLFDPKGSYETQRLRGEATWAEGQGLAPPAPPAAPVIRPYTADSGFGAGG